jgi:hypothetical protein
MQGQILMPNAVYQRQINSNSNSNSDSDNSVLEPPVRLISWHYKKEIRRVE